MTRNSIDASGDRDFVVEALAAAALAMVHLSRLAEELVWWSNPGFGFLRLSDAFSTGSSMMPNKRNPDPAELVRGRTARVIGHLTGVLALLKGLPLGYQRDLQEDKPPLFEGVRILRESLAVLGRVVAGLEVDAARMREAVDRGYLTAVSAADALTDLGVAFRDAHHVLGRLVRQAEELGVTLEALDDAAILRRARRERGRRRQDAGAAAGHRRRSSGRPCRSMPRSRDRTSSAARRPAGWRPSSRSPQARLRLTGIVAGVERSAQRGAGR